MGGGKTLLLLQWYWVELRQRRAYAENAMTEADQQCKDSAHRHMAVWKMQTPEWRLSDEGKGYALRHARGHGHLLRQRAY